MPKVASEFNLASLLECSEHYLSIKYSSGMGLSGILVHPHLLVQATNEWFLPPLLTFKGYYWPN